MFNWILKNKEWLFSGIGVPVARRLLNWARCKITASVTSPTIDTVPPVVANRRTSDLSLPSGRIPTLPSANEIALTVNQSPPFQRSQVGSNYVGLVVSWPIIFFSLIPLNQRRCRLTLAYGAETWGAKLTMTVDIAEYPRLKTAIEPDPFGTEKKQRLIHGWIDGTIAKCGSGEIEIEPTKLEFFD